MEKLSSKDVVSRVNTNNFLPLSNNQKKFTSKMIVTNRSLNHLLYIRNSIVQFSISPAIRNLVVRFPKIAVFNQLIRYSFIIRVA